MIGHTPLEITTSTLRDGLSPILPGALDPDAVRVIRQLQRNHHRAYLVGGCVRDLLLGFLPKDFDVATSARPRQIKKVIRNSRIIGRRFRLVHVHCSGGKVLEVSTFRKDPRDDPPDPADQDEDLLIVQDNVFGSEEQDAVRRDFTINALFYDVENDTVYDYVDGVSDLRRRVLRTIGDPVRRIREDPVRILRAVKFVTRLGLTLDAELAAAMAEYHEDLARSASARVFEELLRMLGGPKPARAFELMSRLGILWVLVPELELRPHDSGEDQRLQSLMTRLQAMSTIDMGRRSLPTAVYYSVLLYDVLRERMLERPNAPQAAVDDLVRDFAMRARLSRRDAGRMRSLFQGLRRIDPIWTRGKKRRGRRKVPLRELARRQYFLDALQVFRILVQAEGRDEEELATWQERAREAAAEHGPPEDEDHPPERGRRGSGPGRRARPSSASRRREPAPEEDASASSSRRRRRRRRGGRGGRSRRPASAREESSPGPRDEESP